MRNKHPMAKHPLHPHWRLLTLNCHEAWIHQLESLACPLDIIDGLPNRLVTSWDYRIRPLPINGRLITLSQAHATPGGYDCIIAHSIQDMMDVKEIPGARILVIHNRMESRVQSATVSQSIPEVQSILKNYLALVGGSVVAVSTAKGGSWGFSGCDVVEFGTDVDHYPPWRGTIAAGLRIANQIEQKKAILLWEFHQAAFADIPVTIVGVNPTMPDARPSKDWADLKETLAAHRFYIHTAHPELEDGYNMATVEAMAAGLPILGNCHPTSPVEHGKSGFLSDDPQALNQYARMLLQDQALAERLGQQARSRVVELFSLPRFAAGFKKAIEKAMHTTPAG
ncbi:MAG: glycosyltransferase family 4 protein [Magnetococcales bacterium]|nr:glycosyltransferase family 4 protein [Magnetococcales bacterium]